MSIKRLTLGRSGEKAAARYLKKKGHSILQKNYRNRSGEIDLITINRDIIVFIEVKTRSSDSHGSALAAVTPKKQRQISKVALEYLSKNKLFDTDARFDVISVKYNSGGEVQIEHIKNAFELCYGV